MKLTDILLSANTNLFRSKLRTALTIVSIFIGALTITLTVGITSGVSSYIDKQVGSVGAKDVLMIQPKIEIETNSGPQKYDPNQKQTSGSSFFSSMLDDADIKKLSSYSKIFNVKPIQSTAIEYVSGPNNQKYQFEVRPIIDSMNIDLIVGRKPDNQTTKSEILLPVDYVSVLGFKSNQAAVGAKLILTIKNPAGQFKDVEVTIVGVQEKSIISQGGASINDSTTSNLVAILSEGLPDNATKRYFGAYGFFDPSISKDELKSIKAELNDDGYQARTIDDQLGIIKQVIEAISGVLIFFGAIALLAASFGIINTLFMSVQERTKEIGLMKAMGMSKSKIFLLFSVEAILIGFWGSLIGMLTAIGIGQIANKIASDGFLKDLPGFALMTFPIPSLVMIGLIVMLIAFLAGTLPARRAARQDPIEALRYE